VPVTFTTGLDYETMSERRKGYENFVMSNGAPQYGEKGDLRRNERNLMWNVDPYLQTQWQLTEKLSRRGRALQLGLVRFQRLLHYAGQRR
jgi:iron complex outermembrane receptor protein